MLYLKLHQAVHAYWRRTGPVSSAWHCRCSSLDQQAKTQTRRSKAKRASRSKEKSDARRNATRREHRLSQALRARSPPSATSQPSPAAGPELDRQRPPPDGSPLTSSPDQPERLAGSQKRTPAAFASDGRLESRLRSSDLAFGKLRRSDRTKEKASLFGWLLKNTPGSDVAQCSRGPTPARSRLRASRSASGRRRSLS